MPLALTTSVECNKNKKYTSFADFVVFASGFLHLKSACWYNCLHAQKKSYYLSKLQLSKKVQSTVSSAFCLHTTGQRF